MIYFDLVTEMDKAITAAGRIYSTGQIVRKLRAKALKHYRDQGDDEITAAQVRMGLDHSGPGGLSGMVLRFIEGRLAVRTSVGLIDQRNFPNRVAFVAAVRGIRNDACRVGNRNPG